jgi:hypothetical protein
MGDTDKQRIFPADKYHDLKKACPLKISTCRYFLDRHISRKQPIKHIRPYLTENQWHAFITEELDLLVVFN